MKIANSKQCKLMYLRRDLWDFNFKKEPKIRNLSPQIKGNINKRDPNWVLDLLPDNPDSQQNSKIKENDLDINIFEGIEELEAHFKTKKDYLRVEGDKPKLNFKHELASRRKEKFAFLKGS